MRLPAPGSPPSQRRHSFRVGSAGVSSERLPDAERKVKMAGALVPKLSDLVPSHRVGRDVGVAGKVRRIQIVSEVEAQWSNRRLISHPHANRVRNIVVIALQVRDLLETELLVRLVKAPQAGEHFLWPRKNVSHIVKNRKADAIQKVRHSNVWK